MISFLSVFSSVKTYYTESELVALFLFLNLHQVYGLYRSDIVIKKGKLVSNIVDGYHFYDVLCERLKEDHELVDQLRHNLTDDCHPDPELKTLTIDFGYYVYSAILKKNKKDETVTSTEADAVNLNDSSDDNIDELTSVIVSDGAEAIMSLPSYTKADFLSEVYLADEQFEDLSALLKQKKNIIIQGVPGVGKTFVSKRLAYTIMGVKDEKRIEFIQFHQNYNYEDFIMGYKPNGEGFELKEGVFYRFCKKAQADPTQDYFFIIDEINRGNLSKIFGEVLMLIEKDYRDKPLTLANNDIKFSIPNNLYIIGMMNTADRSLALLDYALRRRFSFYNLQPAFDSTGFREYMQALNHSGFERLINAVKELNEEITDDESLGSFFCIGHSYFCGAETVDNRWLKQIVEYDILPLLGEYWFDNSAKVDDWKNRLRTVVSSEADV